ncbi:PP2C family protein-serine/threonine phosphatase [Streptomyces sp. NBC_01429]|uniref:PP2C family protein-serine/threonine phosphatase n=1 Tax=Streptomyces sp. NBC_01429 TaxID=2903862 RepID=UPI002E2C7E17|nr:PP2C family protein-serine/threonine phosphatase [Streptomyces sp. NBC_01429]
MPKVAGIDALVPAPAHTDPPLDDLPVAPVAFIQDRLAGWVSDLTTLHELTERLAGIRSLDAVLHELLRAGAALVGAGRGLVVLEPADGLGPVTTLGLGLSHADLGQLETVPRHVTSYGALFAGAHRYAECTECTGVNGHAATTGYPGTAGRPEPGGVPEPVCVPDLLALPDLDPREREVAARLGYGASYAVPLTGMAETAASAATQETEAGTEEGTEEEAAGTGTGSTGDTGSTGSTGSRGSVGAAGAVGATADTAAGTGPGRAAATPPPEQLGAVIWLYDEPAEPTERQRHLVSLYTRYAGEQLARMVELHRARTRMTALAEELLPSLLPRVPGVQLAARHRTGPLGGGDWYDALPLPEGALSLAVGSVSGSGPGAVAASGRLRACLRAYAVMEGEDPVAVLSDLELLLRLTEPARTATALFAYAEPDRRRIVLAGAGHAPPLIVGDRRTEFVETSLSAPLTVLSCWQAPSVVVSPAPGETVLLYTDGLLRRTGEPMDRAFARLHAAAASVPAAARRDPGAIADHVLRGLLPEPAQGAGRRGDDCGDDIVLLAARFD